MKCEVLDIIISFVKSYKNKQSKQRPFLYSKYKNKKIYINNTDYILNQILRQISIPQENFLISEQAYDLWREITDEPIEKYSYRERIKVKYDGAEVFEYKGLSKNPYLKRTLSKGDSFIYNDVFHNEHIIPIKIIIEELLKLHTKHKLNYKNIIPIFNNIYICRMLKSEDRNIKIKYKRYMSKDEIISTIYNEAKIKIIQVKTG